MRFRTCHSLPVSLVVVIAAFGCESSDEEVLPTGIDLDLFEQSTGFDELALQLVSPQSPTAYIELRKQELSSEAFTIVFAHGEKCGDAIDPPACETRFAEMPTAGDGFRYVEHPNDKYHYFAITEEGTSSTVDNAGEMKRFLGTIDNATEALFLAAAQNYSWSATEPSQGAVRQTDDGFELIVTRTSLCPIETTGYLLSVSTTGETSILNSWVVRPDEGFCS